MAAAPFNFLPLKPSLYLHTALHCTAPGTCRKVRIAQPPSTNVVGGCTGEGEAVAGAGRCLELVPNGRANFRPAPISKPALSPFRCQLSAFSSDVAVRLSSDSSHPFSGNSDRCQAAKPLQERRRMRISGKVTTRYRYTAGTVCQYCVDYVQYEGSYSLRLSVCLSVCLSVVCLSSCRCLPNVLQAHLRLAAKQRGMDGMTDAVLCTSTVR